jgi:transcriptional regulator with XRE-family HTH domain
MKDGVFNRQLGKRMRVMRVERGLLLSDVARALDCTISQISRREVGDNVITAAQIVRLAQLYGCPVGELFEGLKL